MNTNRSVLTQEDGYSTVLYPYFCKKEVPEGTFVILHGMAEHHERYDEFARFLNDNNYDVYLFDHRGHGTDKKLEDLGYFAYEHGDQLVVRDAIAVIKFASEKNRGTRLFVFGHSMGSIIARNVIQYYDEMNAVILSGTTFPSNFKTSMGILVSGCLKKIRGPKHISAFLDHCTLGGHAYTKLSDRTAYDWLTRCNTSVGAYIHDPFCGFLCTTSFFNDLYHLTANAANLVRIKKTRKNLPILLISGSDDPVGGSGTDITRLFHLYQRLGFSKTDCTLYSGARHELLNELNKQEVMEDILNWVKPLR